jgi:2-polyprenyl-3-methyl-5-hydroxy-6-metoxy-1,4-benzoquinol methylase
LKPIFELEKKNRSNSINERPAEYAFTFKHLQQLCNDSILDVGSGTSSWPHLLSMCGFNVKAIDKISDYWDSFSNRHYKIINDDITSPKTNEQFQFITCISVLEHIPEHEKAVKNMHKLLKKNGYLILTFPYNENLYHPNIYSHPEAGYGQNANFITQIYSRVEINKWLKNTGFKIIDQEYYKTFSGELWTMGKRLAPSLKVTKQKHHHLTCILLQKTEN